MESCSSTWYHHDEEEDEEDIADDVDAMPAVATDPTAITDAEGEEREEDVMDPGVIVNALRLEPMVLRRTHWQWLVRWLV